MKATYQIVTLKDHLHDSAAIVHTLRAIYDGLKRDDLRLVNYHHEIPVSFPVAIERIDRDVMDVQVHPTQAVVLAEQKQALIKSNAFPQGLGVHAIVEYANVRNRFATLGRFAYASIRAERRDSVRVAVGEPHGAVYLADRQKTSGQLLDISLSGVALLSEHPLPAGIPEQGELRFSLLDIPLDIPARLVGSRRRDGQHLHTFQLEADRSTEQLVSRFIFSRQAEIIRDLRERLGEDERESITTAATASTTRRKS